MELNQVAPAGALPFEDPDKKLWAGKTGATLAKRFGVIPFSVLNARDGYWQARKREWIALGIKGEEGRQDVADANNIVSEKWARGVQSEHYRKPEIVPGGGGPNSVRRLAAKDAGRCFGQDIMKGEHVLGTESADDTKGVAGTSIFDPVLCECMYKWFGKKGGRILDPFAGGSTRGVVAGFLGYDYVGVDIRVNQVEANRRQADDIVERLLASDPNADILKPTWIVGDSTRLSSVLDEGDPFGAGFDFIWTCPPYFDLEIYSENEGDGSTFREYEKFIVWYKDIFRQAVERLNNNRFVAVVIGDVRDHTPLHSYQGNKDASGREHLGLEADTIRVFRELGLYFYNRFVLVTAVGSLPVRIGAQFPTYRKHGNTHQMVYVFWKGELDHKAIPRELGILAKEDIENAQQQSQISS